MDNFELKTFIFGGGALILGVLLLMSRVGSQPVTVPGEHAEAEVTPPKGYVKQMDYNKHPELTAKYLNDLATKSKGKFSSLSPEEQSWLDRSSEGHGAEFIENKYKVLIKQEKAKKAASTTKPAPSEAKSAK